MPKAVVGGSIEFEELAGSPKLSGSVEGPSQRGSLQVVRVGKIAWGDQAALLSELFPAPPSLPGKCPDTARVYAQTCDFAPFLENGDIPTPVGDMAVYSYAVATIRYGMLSYDETTMLSHEQESQYEFMTLPSAVLKWQFNDNRVASDRESIGKLIPIIRHTVRVHRATSIPFSSIKANIGKVNDLTMSAAMTALFPHVTDWERLLFTSANAVETWDSAGNKSYEISYEFQEKNIQANDEVYGWNHFYDSRTGEWDRLLTFEEEKTVYPRSDFDGLFST